MTQINLEELSKFLVKAKINTYASNGEGREKTLLDGSKELAFKEKELEYRDRYFGFNPFIGEEIVWHNGVAVWGMNYYGKIITSNLVSEKDIYQFLRGALKDVREFAPFRGPSVFVDRINDKNLRYINKWEGTVREFNGEETIFLSSESRIEQKILYTLQYKGGLIEHKN